MRNAMLCEERLADTAACGARSTPAGGRLSNERAILSYYLGTDQHDFRKDPNYNDLI
jgi:hypothetical protein